MSDAATMYETREAIATQVARAERLRGSGLPGLAAFSPLALYAGIALAIVIGAAVNMTGPTPTPATASVPAQLAQAR
jgi:hypothetical protein